MAIFNTILSKFEPDCPINEKENAKIIISHIIKRSNHLINGKIYMDILLSNKTISDFFVLLEVLLN